MVISLDIVELRRPSLRKLGYSSKITPLIPRKSRNSKLVLFPEPKANLWVKMLGPS